MKKVFSGCLVLLTMSACSPTDSVNPEQQLLQEVSENFVEKYYSELNTRTQTMASYDFNCSEGLTSIDRTELQTQWRSAMVAWQGAKITRFGPLTEQRLDWEFQFWPDKKNLAASKIKPLLKDSTTKESLQKASVVTHGLSAMEYLLFDTTPIKEDHRVNHCQLIKTVSENIADNAAKLEKQWLLFKPEFTGNGQAPDTWNADEYIGSVIDSVLVTLEEIANRKINAPAGLEQGKINPYFLESWRSQHSLENIQANLQAIQNLLLDSGLKPYLADKGLESLMAPGITALEKALEVSNNLNKPLFDSLDSQTEQLKELSQQINLVKADIRDKWVPALKLPIGFNDNDGD